MVTNLPAEARSQWRKVMEAKTPEEKLEALKRFYSLIPKHKGTKNLVRSVRTQMARLREEIEEKKKKKVGRYISPWSFTVNGDIKVLVISSNYALLSDFLDRTLGNSERYMLWRMLPTMYTKIINDIEVAFSVAPPLGADPKIDDKILNIFKQVDFVLGIAKDKMEVKFLKDHLLNYGFEISSEPIKVSISKTPSGGIRVYNVAPPLVEDIRNRLRRYGIHNAIIKVYGKLNDGDTFEEIILGIRNYFKGNYIIIEDSNNFKTVKGERYKFNEMGNYLIKELGLIRVYPCRDIKEEVGKPIVLKSGATVADLAGEIHTSFKDRIRYALVLRNGKVIRVSPSANLQDMDKVTIKLKV